MFGRIVKKAGSSLYWDDWSKDIATIAGRYIRLIEQLLEDPEHQDAFQEFVVALRQTLNPSVVNASAVEMLAQHILAAPLFDAMFPDHSFSKQNLVSRAMNTILEKLTGHSMIGNEHRELDSFYRAMIEHIEAVHTLAGKQEIMRTLYDRFLSQAFPRMSERLGIVFTPVEVVDFIIRSADDAMRTAFGQSLGNPAWPSSSPSLGPAPSWRACCSWASSRPRPWNTSTRTTSLPTSSCCSPTTSRRSISSSSTTRCAPSRGWTRATSSSPTCP